MEDLKDLCDEISESGGYMARTNPKIIKKTNKNLPQIAEIFK